MVIKTRDPGGSLTLMPPKYGSSNSPARYLPLYSNGEIFAALSGNSTVVAELQRVERWAQQPTENRDISIYIIIIK